MAEYRSRYFNAMQLASLERIGNRYMPGNGNLPSFSQTACLDHADVVLAEVDPGDRQLLGVLLLVLRFMPGFMIEWLLTLMDNHHRYPEWMAGPLRLMNLALKGITMSLYYSGLRGAGATGNPVHDVMGYALHCEPDQGKTQ
ncbi:MAG: hypothetical protein R3208_16950 [Ketobacteraceae bacterium]|nr:hypothetical protein [Ketobacteraceae bacterium]